MLSATCNAWHRFCKECYLQVVSSKYIPHYMLDLTFIIPSLHWRRILPVDFKLLHDMVIASGVAHLSSYSAYFLVSHLDTEAIAIEYLERLLKSCIYRSYSPLPVLLFKFLRGGKLISVRFVIRSFYPELELSCTS